MLVFFLNREMFLTHPFRPPPPPKRKGLCTFTHCQFEKEFIKNDAPRTPPSEMERLMDLSVSRLSKRNQAKMILRTPPPRLETFPEPDKKKSSNHSKHVYVMCVFVCFCSCTYTQSDLITHLTKVNGGGR